MPELLQAPKTTKSRERLFKDDLIPRKFRIVSARELAGFLLLEELVIRSFQAAGIITYANNQDGDPLPGRYDLYDCTQRIFTHERNDRKSRKASVTTIQGQLDVAKLQKERVITERQVMQTQIVFNNALRKDDVIKEWNNMILAVRSKLLSWAWHTARMLLGIDDYKQMVLVLNRELEKLSTDLTECDPDKITAHDRKVVQQIQALKNGQDIQVESASDGE